jgi:hypothetical protein
LSSVAERRPLRPTFLSIRPQAARRGLPATGRILIHAIANEYEIERWVERFAADPILSCAAKTLRSLKDAVNSCSDGWPYWQAAARSAQQLVALLADADRAERRGASHGLTAVDLDRAYRPTKAFRTRNGAKYGFDFDFHYPAVDTPALTLFP